MEFALNFSKELDESATGVSFFKTIFNWRVIALSASPMAQLYNVALISAVQQHESAVSIHISPPC